MPDKFFLDTNVFVYSFDSTVPTKQRIAQELIHISINDGNGVISYQVIQEFLNVSTRKFAMPLSPRDAQIYLASVLEPMCAIFSSIELYHDALEILHRWKYSFYDSLIIAAALKANSSILYTEDLQADQNIQGLRIVNPFE